MNRIRFWLLAVAGILLPVALTFAAYFISTGFSASAEIPAVPAQRMDGSVTENPSPTPDARRTDDRNRGSDDKASPTPTVSSTPLPTVTDDHRGTCSEADHTNDPTCTSGSGGGSGSGDDGSGSSSGSGSSGSGSGSGGDD